MAVCVCRYPIISIDKRNKVEGDIEYISFPVEIIDARDGTIPVPKISVVKKDELPSSLKKFVVEKKLDNILEWVRVDWDEPSTIAKEYIINGHIVLAGCREEDIKCDIKAIFVVYHPIEEWYDHHVVEIK